MQFIRMVNTGTTPYDYHHHAIKQIIQPGGDRIVPWDLACSLFGDPTTMDIGQDRARTRSWKQAAGIHNYHLGYTSDEQWEAIRPKVECYDLETGQRVYMVLDDRDGKLTGENPGGQATPGNELEMLQRQMALMAQQIAKLTANQVQAPADATTSTGPITSEDAPNMEPVPSALDLAELTRQATALGMPEATEDIPQAVPTGLPQDQAPRVLAPRPA